MTNSILGFLPAARKTEVEMNPLPASLAVAGFPMTILLSGTTLAAISNTEVLGQVLDEAVRRLLQAVYSLTPGSSVHMIGDAKVNLDGGDVRL